MGRSLLRDSLDPGPRLRQWRVVKNIPLWVTLTLRFSRQRIWKEVLFVMFWEGGVSTPQCDNGFSERARKVWIEQ